MNFAFFGTPEFAAIILEKLIGAGFVPTVLVCNPDRPVGRKKIMTFPPTKALVMNYESRIRQKIKILQPEKLDNEFLNSLFLIHDSFDFFIVAAYAKIIPKEILAIPRLGSIGVHPSLLPRHRGASPIQSAILAGDEVTGVTLFLMDEKVDHGPILTGQALTITNNDNYETLMKKLAELGGDLLVKTLPKFLKGEVKPQVQNEDYATYTKKFKTEDAFVDLKKEDPITVERKVRALNPEPGVWTYAKILRQYYANKEPAPYQGGEERVKILDAEIKDRKLILKKIQFEGKKPQQLQQPQ